MVTATTTPMTKCDHWCTCYVNGSWCRVVVTLGMSLREEQADLCKVELVQQIKLATLSDEAFSRR